MGDCTGPVQTVARPDSTRSCSRPFWSFCPCVCLGTGAGGMINPPSLVLATDFSRFCRPVPSIHRGAAADAARARDAWLFGEMYGKGVVLCCAVPHGILFLPFRRPRYGRGDVATSRLWKDEYFPSGRGPHALQMVSGGQIGAGGWGFRR